MSDLSPLACCWLRSWRARFITCGWTLRRGRAPSGWVEARRLSTSAPCSTSSSAPPAACPCSSHMLRCATGTADLRCTSACRVEEEQEQIFEASAARERLRVRDREGSRRPREGGASGGASVERARRPAAPTVAVPREEHGATAAAAAARRWAAAVYRGGVGTSKVLANQAGTRDLPASASSAARRQPGLADETMAAPSRAESVVDRWRSFLRRRSSLRGRLDHQLLALLTDASQKGDGGNCFRMRTNVKTYNWAAGCSACSFRSISCRSCCRTPNLWRWWSRRTDHAVALLRLRSRCPEPLFRCGGAAILLTNRPRLLWRAKYRLRHLVRTQCSDDASYQAVFQCEDGAGHSGVRLSKDIVKVAGNAMKINLTQLGPLVLPLSEQFKVLWSLLARLGFNAAPKFVPSFKSAIHFFIHAGGEQSSTASRSRSSPLTTCARTQHAAPAATRPRRPFVQLRYVEACACAAGGSSARLRPGFKCNRPCGRACDWVVLVTELRCVSSGARESVYVRR